MQKHVNCNFIVQSFYLNSLFLPSLFSAEAPFPGLTSDFGVFESVDESKNQVCKYVFRSKVFSRNQWAWSLETKTGRG